MQPKKLIFLAVLLAILAGVIVFKKIQQPRNVAFEITRPLELSFDKSAVETLRFKRGTEAVEIQKKDGVWNLSSQWGSRANSSRIDALLEQLGGLRGEMRSSDSALFADYGLQDEAAIRIELLGKESAPVFELLIGTSASDPRISFVRKAGSSEVYGVDRPLLETLGAKAVPGQPFSWEEGYWNDLRLLKGGSVEAIQGLQFARAGTAKGASFGLVKKETGTGQEKKIIWAFDQEGLPFEADAQKAEDLLQMIAGTQALRALDPAGAYGLDKPLVEITLTLQGNGTVKYKVSESGTETKNYYLQSSEDPAVFEIALYHVKRLNVWQNHFFKDNPFGLESEDVQEVLMRHAGQERFLGQTEDKKESLQKIAETLKGMEYEVQAVKDGALPEPAPYQIEIHGKDEKKWVLEFSETAAEERRLFRAAGDPRLFSLPEPLFKSLFAALEESVETPVPTPPAEPASVPAEPAPAV